MNPYLRNESEAEEFDNTVGIVLKLYSRNTKARQMAEKKLLAFGAKSVRPLAYTIDLALWDKSMSDADINDLAHELSEIVLKIGKDALPDLEYLAINENFNLTVTNWAQELIFKVMGVEGIEKQKVCYHYGFLFHSKEDKNIMICPKCDARIPAHKEPEGVMKNVR